MGEPFIFKISKRRNAHLFSYITTYGGIKISNYFNALLLESAEEAECNLALALIPNFHIWIHFR